MANITKEEYEILQAKINQVIMKLEFMREFQPALFKSLKTYTKGKFMADLM